MNSPENETTRPDDTFAKLREVLADNDLKEYVATQGPLRIAELPRDLIMDPDFATFVGEYDWPNGRNAGAIAPVHDYDDANDFWKNLYDSSDHEKYLNNFINWLVAEPEVEWDQTKGIGGAWELSPTLHRGYVVAAPLFSNLRRAILEAPGYSAASGPALESLGAEHPEVKDAAYTAYKLLGRLVVKDDQKMTLRAMGASSRAGEEVSDAHRYLWT